jgi:hypothetical protein
MKSKLRVPFFVTCIVLLVLTCTSCFPIGDNKSTGGGWFIDQASGDMITFGCTAQPTGDGSAKGQFQLVDHDSNTEIHGIFLLTDTNTSGFTGLTEYEGTCSVNGEGKYPLYVGFIDGYTDDQGIQYKNSIGIQIGLSGDDVYVIYGGTLGGGNIVIHK